ncbi:MAG: hypothetical protein ACOYB0_10015 [Polynucleobacter sp.]
MKFKFAILIPIIFFSANVFAGLFGPSNYEECVLDRMKGQDRWLLSTAREACLIKFPPPPTEQVVELSNSDWSWKKTDANTLTIEVHSLPKNVKLTSVNVALFANVCGEKPVLPGVNFLADKSSFSNKFIVKVDAGVNKFHCANVTFLGFVK